MHNQEKDLVSIIIPVYNVAPFLNRCMQSVLGQTYSQLEIILIDDGSTDGSGFMCDEYASKDSRIVVIHQDNRGLSAARNVGAFLSQGKYVCFVDPDDELDVHYIEILHDAMVSQKVSLVMCSYTVLFEKMKQRVVVYPCEEASNSTETVFTITTDEYIHNYVERRKASVTAWSRMYTAELAREVSFPEGRVYEDLATHIVFAICATKIAIVVQSLYLHYKQRHDSITSTISEKNIIDSLWAHQMVNEQIIHYNPKLADRAKWIVDEAPLSILINIYMYYTENERQKLREEFIQSIRNDVKNNLFYGSYCSLYTKTKALLVISVPKMLPTLWKIWNMFRKKNNQ